jgi:hypothetical protein
VRLAQHAGNRAGVDDGAAVDLPELLGIELGDEILQRRPDQRLGLGQHHARVLGVGLEVDDVVDSDELDLLADGGLDPAQARRRGLPLQTRAQVVEQMGEIGGRRCELSPNAFDGRRQAIRLHRLEEVVDGTGLECLHRVLVVGGDEDDVTLAADQRCDIESAATRHANVEECHLRRVHVEGRERRIAVRHLGDD